MHMADALISPAVGGAMWAASAAAVAYSARRVGRDADERKAPLMGVLGAFVFAAQMINFTIPGTGSSGHLGGGMLLAALLGPHAAFLALTSVVTVQALFFADGGLLALGCNIFNMGVLPCFVAYPLFARIVGNRHGSAARLWTGSLVASVLALQLGAFAVVAETSLSGIAELPFKAFVILMLPIHLAIGLVEGVVTAAVVNLIVKARPEMVDLARQTAPKAGLRTMLVGLGVVAVLTAGVLSWYASESPDGLEWSIQRVTGHEELQAPPDPAHAASETLQSKTAFLPDYAPKSSGESEPSNAGRSFAGVVGVVATLVFAGVLGWVLRGRMRRE